MGEGRMDGWDGIERMNNVLCYTALPGMFLAVFSYSDSALSARASLKWRYRHCLQGQNNLHPRELRDECFHSERHHSTSF
jgi:hypothetical protein